MIEMDDSNPYNESLGRLPVTSNMKSNPPQSNPDSSISDLIELMMSEDTGAVIIVEGEQPVGILTEKDILSRVVSKGKDFKTTLAKEVMTKPIITIETDHTISEALDILREAL